MIRQDSIVIDPRMFTEKATEIVSLPQIMAFPASMIQSFEKVSWLVSTLASSDQSLSCNPPRF
jgi:hypothetical protein